MLFYFTLIPLGLFLLIKYAGKAEEPLSYISFVSIYGYSFAIFLPAIILYVVPSNMLRWVILLGSGLVSLYFIAKELIQMVKSSLGETEMKAATITVCVLHGIFILILKWKFL